MIARPQARADVARSLAELGQVLADAESAPGAGDDDGADVRVAGLFERSRETLVQCGIERVENVRTAERDREDSALATRLDLGHHQDFRRSTEQ